MLKLVSSVWCQEELMFGCMGCWWRGWCVCVVMALWVPVCVCVHCRLAISAERKFTQLRLQAELSEFTFRVKSGL